MAHRPGHFESPTVQKLLYAAETEFELYGYAGARIDQIASRAGMAKSLVYYHFANKRQILDDLIAMRIVEIRAETNALLVDMGGFERPANTPVFVRRVVSELLAPRAAFLRIVLFECLWSDPSADSDTDGLPALCLLLNPLLEDIVGNYESWGFEVDREALMSDVLHFGIIPAVIHVAAGPKVAAVLGVTPERADELLISRLTDLQVGFVKSLPHAARGSFPNEDVP